MSNLKPPNHEQTAQNSNAPQVLDADHGAAPVSDIAGQRRGRLCPGAERCEATGGHLAGLGGLPGQAPRQVWHHLLRERVRHAALHRAPGVHVPEAGQDARPGPARPRRHHGPEPQRAPHLLSRVQQRRRLPLQARGARHAGEGRPRQGAWRDLGLVARRGLLPLHVPGL